MYLNDLAEMMLSMAYIHLVLAALVWTSGSHAYTLDVDDEASVKSVASSIAYDMMSYYHGNESGQIPGQLPGPPPTPAYLHSGYFWWESGAMWGAMIDYWYYTGDSTYNQEVIDGIMWQTGEDNDFEPANQTLGLGNDDQAFWAMTAMSAAELNFPNPPASKPQWLSLAIAVYNRQKPRWDPLCGGGLRWQAYSFLNGYDYKNSISNGCFFNIAARLARYTGNDTYAQEAEKTWEWVRQVGFMTDTYSIYDGAHVETNCTDINPIQFSYNQAIFLHGAAVMYDYTNGSAIWKDRLDGLLNATFNIFFPNNIGTEVACETGLTCNIDMFSMKAYLARWMAATTQLAPYTYDSIMLRLKASASAAAQQCSGGTNGRMCGLSWSKLGDWDGTYGVGQQMAALEVIQGTLIKQKAIPFTNSTGGTSVGNPDAGISVPVNPRLGLPNIKTADRVGAWILTFVILGGFGTMFGFMCSPVVLVRKPTMPMVMMEKRESMLSTTSA